MNGYIYDPGNGICAWFRTLVECVGPDQKAVAISLANFIDNSVDVQSIGRWKSKVSRWLRGHHLPNIESCKHLDDYVAHELELARSSEQADKVATLQTLTEPTLTTLVSAAYTAKVIFETEGSSRPSSEMFTHGVQAPIGDFVDRRTALSALKAKFRKGRRAGECQPTVVSLTSLSGGGKSQLARLFAQDCIRRRGTPYRAIIWLDGGSEAALNEGASNCLHRMTQGGLSLSESSQSPIKSPFVSLADALRTLGRYLLVVDGLDCASLLDTLLQSLGESVGHVLITSRNPGLEAHSAVIPVILGPLSKKASAHMIQKRVKKRADSEMEFEAALRLAELLDGVPLALEQACAYIVEQRIMIDDCYAAICGQGLSILENTLPCTGGYHSTLAGVWGSHLTTMRATYPNSFATLNLLSLFRSLPVSDKLLVDLVEVSSQIVLSPGSHKLPASIVAAELGKPLSHYSLVQRRPGQKQVEVPRLFSRFVREAWRDKIATQGAGMDLDMLLRLGEFLEAQARVNDEIQELKSAFMLSVREIAPDIVGHDYQ